MSELLFEYKVRYRYKTGYKEFSFYATTEIEEFLNRNNIEYVRNMTDTVESRLFKEIERLNKQIEAYQKALDETTSEKVDLHSIINKIRNYVYKPIDKEWDDILCIIEDGLRKWK